MSSTGEPTGPSTGHRWTSETAKAARARVRTPLEPERIGTHAEDVAAGFDEVERRLVDRDFPSTSPWWRATLGRWWASGVRQLVARVGRRGGKSSTLCRLAVVEMLYGHHDIPPGDTGWVAIISTDRNEALGRLRTVEAILGALGIEYEPAKGLKDAIVLTGRRVGVRVYTASIKGVSGFTALFVLCDEVAKWADAETGANPATEVLASVTPTLATMPNGRIVLSSSPWSILDAHYDAFERGDGPGQIVAWAETWVANPSLTEAYVRALPPHDDEQWNREFRAIPMATTESALLTEALVDRARRHPPMPWDLPPEDGHVYAAYMDPAVTRNAWTLVLVTRDDTGRRRVALARQWRGNPRAPLVPGNVFREMAGVLAPYGVRAVRSDQWAEVPLRELAAQHGLALLTDYKWDATTKREAYEALLTALAQQTLELHADPLVKADILCILKKETRAGTLYDLLEHDGRHADYAPPLAMAAIEALRSADPPAGIGVNADAEEMKRQFLLGREKERKRAERYGRLPVTHRRR